ncbi:MAG: hypothetical protein GEU92_08395 [Alphaproteobacteria bacterium]|nr:hypothetical protein [Alphaproteobacteria bacterium]
MRGIAFASLAALVLTGCARDGRDARDAYVTADGYERMSTASTPLARRGVARENCVQAGLPEGTRRFARCVAAYHAMDAKVARDRAKELRDRAAVRHGVCIDPDRLTVGRCLEI